MDLTCGWRTEKIPPQRTLARRQARKEELMAVQGQTSDKSFITALLLSIFLGGLGVDRFYLGYSKLGVLKLITCGGVGVWSIIDIIMIATGKVTDVNGLPLKK
jgi:TM2 domain-containing membrane protein YozV